MKARRAVHPVAIEQGDSRIPETRGLIDECLG